MKVAFFALNASYVHTSLSIRCLSEYLCREHSNEFNIELIEKSLKDKRNAVLKTLVDSDADIYGFSCYIWNLSDMLSFAHDLKSLKKNAIIIIGGPEVSYETERFDKCNYIDYIITGEGEVAFATLCNDIKKGSLPESRVIDGNSFIRIDDYSSPHVYHMSSASGKIVYYESSRGCPFRCSYCVSSLCGKPRGKSTSIVLSELLEFEKSEPDTKTIKFIDRTFNYNISRANEIWKALADEKYTKTYHFEIAASLLNEESFEIIKKLPQDKVQFEVGLQSTNSKTLLAIDRRDDSLEVLNNVKKLYSFGNAHIHLDLIAGLPYETLETFKIGFNNSYGVCDMLQLGMLKMLPGTKIRREAEKFDYKYMNTAPYTVLQNSTMTFENLCLIDDLSHILQRFYESGSFVNSINYMVQLSSSPFDAYINFHNFISYKDGRNITQISQPDAYRLLYSYLCTLENVDLTIAEEKIHQDFSSAENRKKLNLKNT